MLAYYNNFAPILILRSILYVPRIYRTRCIIILLLVATIMFAKIAGKGCSVNRYLHSLVRFGTRSSVFGHPWRIELIILGMDCENNLLNIAPLPGTLHKTYLKSRSKCVFFFFLFKARYTLCLLGRFRSLKLIKLITSENYFGLFFLLKCYCVNILSDFTQRKGIAGNNIRREAVENNDLPRSGRTWYFFSLF